ncbi:disulfide bond formation protein DsbA [Niabella ginsenosidivorans]|uniref:Disulfide bond formation protein DsbA n=1 Tax=Niabella ginsenosidivorans TaxID=1176587 RepID=A0A1A9I089_9BACT|nr:thioredoxin domain-containing protein [Niabella ginsenosidivorans]ANH80150.1 disulfide bond formation protein DsbA [Niabella ginsenosidivorans]
MSVKKDAEEIIEPKDVFVGKKDAPITLMEFGEYESEECAKANEVVKQILEAYEGKVKFNFRHFPQTRIHQRSLKAAESAIAAAQEGKFWEMHNVLFQNRRNLGTTSLKLHSKDAGVKNKNFLEELVNGTYGWQVQDDLKYGLDLGVKEVPTFFINGVMIKGKTTYALLSGAIEEALKGVKKKAAAKTKAKPKTAAKTPAKTKAKSK